LTAARPEVVLDDAQVDHRLPGVASEARPLPHDDDLDLAVGDHLHGLANPFALLEGATGQVEVGQCSKMHVASATAVLEDVLLLDRRRDHLLPRQGDAYIADGAAR
jgi:hypothetical protein